MKSIVITGTSTGIGYETAKEFIKKGYHVFGSVRKPDDADRLKKELGENFTPLIFDITDHKAISDAARFVREKLGDNGLTGLVNNAGTAEGSPFMHMSVDNFRNHLEVLLVGHFVVIREFLPLLGATRDYPYKPGKIINVTSINGKIAAPFLTGYVASKHAFEGLSNTLRIELQIYGIDVIIVAPGRIKTAIWDKASEDKAEAYRDTDYYLPGKKFNSFLKKSLPKEALEADVFSNKLVKIFELKHPKTRYTIARKRFKNWTLMSMIPNRVLDKIFAKLIGLDRV